MHINELGKIKALILDMDGVLWRENSAIGDLPWIFDRFAALDLRVVLATNNGTRTPEQYIQKISSFGVKVKKEQIINSAMAVAHLLKKRFPNGGRVYILGEVGLSAALNDAGFYHAEENVLAVIGGMDRAIDFPKLKCATLLIRAGAPFYFTNPDTTYPTPEGLIPGAGSILAALETACDVKAIIAGKPSPALFEFALANLGTSPEHTLVVGDRLETDILGGQIVNCKTALVLSGVATASEAEQWLPKIDLILPELADLVK
jgi:4-nitrophenyl phosphatase